MVDQSFGKRRNIERKLKRGRGEKTSGEGTRTPLKSFSELKSQASAVGRKDLLKQIEKAEREKTSIDEANIKKQIEQTRKQTERDKALKDALERQRQRTARTGAVSLTQTRAEKASTPQGSGAVRQTVQRTEKDKRTESTQAQDIQFIPGFGQTSKQAREIIGTEQLVKTARKSGRTESRTQAQIEEEQRVSRLRERFKSEAESGRLQTQLADVAAGVKGAQLPNVLTTSGLSPISFQELPTSQRVTFAGKSTTEKRDIPIVVNKEKNVVFVQAGKGFPEGQKTISVNVVDSKGNTQVREFRIKRLSGTDLKKVEGEKQNLELQVDLPRETFTVDVSKSEIETSQLLRRLEGQTGARRLFTESAGRFQGTGVTEETAKYVLGKSTKRDLNRAIARRRLELGSVEGDPELTKDRLKTGQRATAESVPFRAAVVSSAIAAPLGFTIGAGSVLAPVTTRAVSTVATAGIGTAYVSNLAGDIRRGKPEKALAKSFSLPYALPAGYLVGSAGAQVGAQVGRVGAAQLSSRTFSRTSAQIISKQRLESGTERIETVEGFRFKPNLESTTTGQFRSTTFARPGFEGAPATSKSIGIGQLTTTNLFGRTQTQNVIGTFRSAVPKGSTTSKDVGLLRTRDDLTALKGYTFDRGTVRLETGDIPSQRITRLLSRTESTSIKNPTIRRTTTDTFVSSRTPTKGEVNVLVKKTPTGIELVRTADVPKTHTTPTPKITKPFDFTAPSPIKPTAISVDAKGTSVSGTSASVKSIPTQLTDRPLITGPIQGTASESSTRAIIIPDSEGAVNRSGFLPPIIRDARPTPNVSIGIIEGSSKLRGTPTTIIRDNTAPITTTPIIGNIIEEKQNRSQKQRVGILPIELPTEITKPVQVPIEVQKPIQKPGQIPIQVPGQIQKPIQTPGQGVTTRTGVLTGTPRITGGEFNFFTPFTPIGFPSLGPPDLGGSRRFRRPAKIVTRKAPKTALTPSLEGLLLPRKRPVSGGRRTFFSGLEARYLPIDGLSTKPKKSRKRVSNNKKSKKGKSKQTKK